MRGIRNPNVDIRTDRNDIVVTDGKVPEGEDVSFYWHLTEDKQQ